MPQLPLYIDTHSHLNHPLYKDSWESRVWQALESDIWTIIVGSDYPSSLRAVEMAEKFPYGVYAAVGVHPFSADSFYEDDLIDFRELVKHPRTVAIGEVGFDLRPSLDSEGDDELYRDQLIHAQQDILRHFLALANEFQLPLIMHAHDAHKELASILDKYDGVRGIVHHFTGDTHDVGQYARHDLLMSLTDMLARSQTRQEVVQNVPNEKVVVEAECPFLSSAGVNHEPPHVSHALTSVAAVRGHHADELARWSTRNVFRVFPKIIRTLPD